MVDVGVELSAVIQSLGKLFLGEVAALGGIESIKSIFKHFLHLFLFVCHVNSEEFTVVNEAISINIHLIDHMVNFFVIEGLTEVIGETFLNLKFGEDTISINVKLSKSPLYFNLFVV